ncbi:MAG: LON peptidase substrate-binding domain-containing protein [Acidimicrobiales bacterium]
METEPYQLAMFPLGSVLFPAMPLPLHLFEPRYLTLADDVVGRDGEFGVVLIERGSEVGGGDQRSSIGTVATIVEQQCFDDGRWALGCVGERRIRVIEWLVDDPYPKALVVNYPESSQRPRKPDIQPEVGIENCAAKLRLAIDRLVLLGEAPEGFELRLSEDPLLASYQISAIGPFGPADKQALLACDGSTSRLAQLDGLLDAAIEMLDFRLC